MHLQKQLPQVLEHKQLVDAVIGSSVDAMVQKTERELG